MRAQLRYWLSVCLLLVGTSVSLCAQGFNPTDPPEPMTQRMVRIIAEPAEGVATITTGGYFSIGQVVHITISPKSGYDFQCWTLNGRTYTQNASFSYTVGDSLVVFTAILKKKPIISVSVSPAAAGSAYGGGTFTPGTSRRIYTTGNTGYVFQYWMLNGERYSNETSFYYTVQDTDADFVAVYDAAPVAPFNPSNPTEPMTAYHITIQTNLPEDVHPTYISSGGYFALGTHTTIRITPPNEYQFLYWTLNGEYYTDALSFDYVVNNNNDIFVAICKAKQRIDVSVTPSDAATASGGGYYAAKTKILLSTIANEGYRFLYWSLNGMRYADYPSFYYIVGGLDVSFVAVYEKIEGYTPETPPEEPFIPSNPTEPGADQTALLITVMANDTALGNVSGLPTTPLFAGDKITLTATPTCDGYYFSHWENNSTANPRTITLTKDAIYVAHFAKRQYLVTFYDEDGSTIVDQRRWNYGDIPTCVSPAKADDWYYSYRFDKWQPTIVAVTQDASYTATYEAITLQSVYPNEVDATETMQKILRNGQFLILRGEKAYTITGQEVK